MVTAETVSVIPSSWRIATPDGRHLGTVSLYEWRPSGQWMAVWIPNGSTVGVCSVHDTQDAAVAAVVAGRVA